MITSYDTMPYGIYLQLLEVIEDKDRSDLDKQVALVALLDRKTEAEILDLPLEEFRERTAALEFLERAAQAPKDLGKFPERMTLAGMTCKVTRDVSRINTAQFVDYQTLIKQGAKALPAVVAIMIVPVGKVYGHTGEGDPLAYDVERIRRAVADELTVTQVNRLAAFFLREWTASLETSLTSLRQLAERTPDPKGTLREKIVRVDRLLTSIRSSPRGDGSTR